MGLRLNIHANGGYDVALEVGNEETTVEWVGYTLDPFTLDVIRKQYECEGHAVTDHRTPAKLRLARAAQEAVEATRNLIEHSVTFGGVEPEAIAMSKSFATEAIRLATECSC